MTTKELIAKLQQADPDGNAQVIADASDDLYCGKVISVSVMEVKCDSSKFPLIVLNCEE